MTSIVLGVLLGFILALCIHELAWYLRLQSPAAAALLGLAGAAVFTAAGGLFLGPYTGEIGRPVLVGMLLVWGVAIVLGSYQSLSFHAPFWIAILALFIEIGLVLLTALLLTLARDAWLNLAQGGVVWPGPGGGERIYSFHQAALLAMIVFVMVLALIRPAYRISARKRKPPEHIHSGE